MKKNLFTLGLVALLTVNAFAEEVSTVEERETIGNIIEEASGKKSEWNHSVRSYLEVEKFNESLNDGAFWGVGVNASRGNWSYDLNVEKRGTGYVPMQTEGNEATRVDYKVRYQALDNVGVHVKYRSENNSGGNMRDRWEVGTDWANVLGTGGWFVVGFDTDSKFDVVDTVSKNGWYWEGDFGPSFTINDKLTITPTLYTTAEFYDKYDFQDHQLRLMASYKVTENFSIMPRIRYSIVRNQTHPESNQWDATGRTRFELMGNNVITPQTSTFWGVAYDLDNREYTNVTKDADELNMFWAYFQLTHAF